MMARQTQVEEECVSAIHSEKPNVVDSVTVSNGFNTAGKNCNHLLKNCVAKIVTDKVNNSVKYYVMARRGNKFFDPAVSKDDVLDTIDKVMGDFAYRFKEVKQSALTLYLDYLKNRNNNSSLLQAERE